MIYRYIHQVFHSISRAYLGDLYHVLGMVRIITVSQGLATARIERAYSSVSPGDGVVAYQPVAASQPEDTDGTLPDVPGRVVDIQLQRTLIRQNQIVYLDWGRDDGLQTGDRLDIWGSHRGSPLQRLGEVRVLGVEDHTAAALITRATTPLAIADRVIPTGGSPLDLGR